MKRWEKIADGILEQILDLPVVPRMIIAIPLAVGIMFLFVVELFIEEKV